MLNAVGNSWMVWSWYHEKGVFPRSYEKLILDVSAGDFLGNLECTMGPDLITL